MGADSKIEWTHHTFNPWMGCTKVSPECANCYAEELMDTRYGKTKWGPRGLRVIKAESGWREPLKWNRDAASKGERARVFCASLADVFEWNDTMPKEAWAAVCAARERLFNLIDETPWLDWLLLTKRPENIRKAMPSPPLNVWLGTSVGNANAKHRIDTLRNTPASVRFLSCEPLIGPLGKLNLDGIHWVIAGGESGPHARPMHPEWAREIRDQCQAAGVAFFFKQWGEFAVTSEPTDAFNRATKNFETVPAGGGMARIGKKAAGRLLDGVEWNEYPSAIASA